MIFALPMWGSEVANSKTELHLTNTSSEVTWACDVTTIEREGDFNLLGMYILLAFGRGRQAIMQTASGTKYPG